MILVYVVQKIYMKLSLLLVCITLVRWFWRDLNTLCSKKNWTTKLMAVTLSNI